MGCVDVTEHGTASQKGRRRWNAGRPLLGPTSMSNFDTARDKSRATTNDSTDLDERDVRALEQYLTVLEDYDRARDSDDLYMVVSESGEEYLVDARAEACECPDFEYRAPSGGCKHVRRVAFATGAREIPASVDRDAVDDQLGLHVTDGEPRIVATDGGVITADGDAVQDDVDERPDDCDCAPWMAHDHVGLPCFECWRNDFETPNPAVLEDDDDVDDDRDRPRRSEPADFGGGESTGVQDLLGGDDDA